MRFRPISRLAPVVEPFAVPSGPGMNRIALIAALTATSNARAQEPVDQVETDELVSVSRHEGI